jgi:vesicle coat complex subunit
MNVQSKSLPVSFIGRQLLEREDARAHGGEPNVLYFATNFISWRTWVKLPSDIFCCAGASLFRWGQTYILESLMFVVPQEPGDAEMLAERIAPRLQHANSAVVLTAVKVIVYLMNYMSKEEDISNMCKKLSPPLGRLRLTTVY